MIFANAYDIVMDDVVLEMDGFLPEASTFLKLEGLNPAGSIKLKTALGLVESVEESGRMEPGARLIESSSGNLGVALAMVCARKGYSLTIVTDSNTNRQSVQLMEVMGAEVVEVTRRDLNGGFLSTRISYILDRLAAEPGLVWLNQYANSANPSAHRKRTARSLHAQLGVLDALFVGVGTSGTAMGCAEYFREHSPQTRLFIVDTVGSVTFGVEPQVRRIPGLGASRRPEIFQDSPDLTKVLVSETAAIRVCRRVARDYGVLIGGSTGAVLAAAEQESDSLPTGALVAAISPDLGDRYLDTIYSDAWVEATYPELLQRSAA